MRNQRKCYALMLSGVMLLAAGMPQAAVAEELQIMVLEGQDGGGVSVTEEYNSEDVSYDGYVSVESSLSERLLEQPADSTVPQLASVNTYNGEWNDEYMRQIAYSSWDVPTVLNADRYGALHAALQRLAEEEGVEAENRLSEAKEFAEGDLQYRDADTIEYMYTSEMKLRRADEDIVSFMLQKSSYTGGAHGYSWTEGHTYRADTGEELLLQDIVTDADQMLSAVFSQLKANYPDLSAVQDEPDYDYWGDISIDNLEWTVEADAVTFYFAPYVLGAYAEGAQSVSLVFTEYPELFTEEVTDRKASTVCELQEWMTVYIDVDHDGAAERVVLTAQYDEYYFISGFTISIGGQEYVQDLYGYEFTGRILQTADSTVLLVETVMENDYRQTVVFNLTSGQPVYVDTIDYAALNWYNEEEGRLYRERITDLSAFRLMARTDVLGTSSIFGYFSADAQGLPVMQSNELYYVYNRNLIAKQDISGKEIEITDEYIREKDSDGMIVSGSDINLIGTDNQSYADIKDTSGTAIRIPVDLSEYPISSGGVNVEDLFAGIMYAG